MVALVPSGLDTITTGDTTWVNKFNSNLVLLNNTLLKLSALLDVNVAGLANGDVLRYDNGTSEWIPWHPDKAPL